MNRENTYDFFFNNPNDQNNNSYRDIACMYF